MTSLFSKQAWSALGISLCLCSSVVALPAVAQDQNEFPGRRVGGGTRGGCAINAAAVVALNPANNLGLTNREQPTLYFAVPETNEAYQVTFYLQDEAADSVYETTLEAGAKTELLGVQIPADTLTVGEYYQWYFVAACDAANPAASIVLEGWIQQTDMAASDVADADSQLAVVQAYQAAGLWSDAIALTAELLAQAPECQEYQAQWFQLLAELGLDTAIDDLLSVRLPNATE